MRFITLSTLQRGILDTPEVLSDANQYLARESFERDARNPYRAFYRSTDVVPRDDTQTLFDLPPDEKVSAWRSLHVKEKRK